jgi:hypothetical protein
LRTERQREILKHYEEVFQKADEMNLKMKKAELRRQLGLELDDLFVSSYKAKGEE